MHARAWSLVLPLLVGFAACEDGTAPTPGPGAPRPAAVLLDTADNLLAKPYPGDIDSFFVVMAERRTLGLILDASGPIGVIHGLTGADVTYSFDGVPVTALAQRSSEGGVRIVVRHVVPHFDATTYDLRIVAVDTTPEHAAASLTPDAVFRRDWVDPPLDLDVYAIDFTGVDGYFVELAPANEDVSLSARMLTPSGLSQFAVLETGAGTTRGAVYSIEESGTHYLLIHATGLKADVEVSYRFRVVDAATIEPE